MTRGRGKDLIEIPQMNGHVSPRLKVRFEMRSDGLWLIGPDGRSFGTYRDVVREANSEKLRADTAEQRAEQERIRAEAERKRAEQLQAELDRERQITALAPLLKGVALVIPKGLLQLRMKPAEAGKPDGFAEDATARDEIERIAMEAVMATERALGNLPA